MDRAKSQAETAIRLDVTSISVSPGDILVVSVPDGHTTEEYKAIHQKMLGMFSSWADDHPGVDVIIVPRTSNGSIRIGALDQESMARLGWVKRERHNG